MPQDEQTQNTFQVTKINSDKIIRNDAKESFCRRGWLIWGIIGIILIIMIALTPSSIFFISQASACRNVHPSDIEAPVI